jgi:hypothetical protein
MRVLVNSCFKLPDVLQGCIPSSLQLIGNQTIVGISAIILLLRSLGRILRGLQIAP